MLHIVNNSHIAYVIIFNKFYVLYLRATSAILQYFYQIASDFDNQLIIALDVHMYVYTRQSKTLIRYG